MGLPAGEVLGQSLLNLAIGLPVEQLPLPAFLAGTADYQEVTLDAITHQGRAIRCHLTCTPFLSADGQRQGVVLLMEKG